MVINSFDIFFLFLVGVSIGYVFNMAFYIKQPQFVNASKELKFQSVLHPQKNLRILCYLHTFPGAYSKKAIHLMQNWGKHCDKLLFASTSTNMNLGTIGYDVPGDYVHLWGKTKQMMQHIYKDYLNDYDWFIKGDDDTFLIIENLRYMLSAYSTDDPIYFGHKYNSTQLKRGFFSGGAAYVMTRQTVRTFVEQVLTNKDFYTNLGLNTECQLERDNVPKDTQMSLCLGLL